MSTGDLATRLERTRHRYGLPALGAAVVDPGGLVDVAVAGHHVRGGRARAHPDDRWHIGSCGKFVTACLYARLVESGAAAWGTPLADLLPDAGAIDPGWRRVTIDDVLTHRSGLPANLDRAGMHRAMADNRPLPDQRASAAAHALASPPRRPGSFRYSNLGYTVAGAVIERLTGLAYEDAVRREVLDPLGVTSAGFGPPPAPGLWGHRARIPVAGVGRGPAVDPRRVAGVSPAADNPPVIGPAGRMHVTLADWARIVSLLLDDGAPLLTPASLERLLAVPAGGGPAQGMGWAVPPRGGRPGGLGGRASFGQQGSNTLWVATALVARDRRRAALVATNDGRTRLLGVTARLAAGLLPA